MVFNMYLYGVPQNLKFNNVEDFWKYVEEDSNNYRDDTFAERYGGWTGNRVIHHWFERHGFTIEPNCCYKLTREKLIELIRDCAAAYLDPDGSDNTIFPCTYASKEEWEDIKENFLYIIDDVSGALNDFDHPKCQYIYVAE